MLLWQEEVTWETGPGFFIVFFFSMYERLLGMDLASLCPQVSLEEMGSCAFSDTARFCSHLPHNPIELRDFHKRGRNQEPDRGILKLKCLLNHRWPRLEVHPRNRCQVLLSALGTCAVCLHPGWTGVRVEGASRKISSDCLLSVFLPSRPLSYRGIENIHVPQWFLPSWVFLSELCVLLKQQRCG